jgi:hypothetical protein
MGYDLHKIGLSRPPIAQQRIARNIILNYYTHHGFSRYEAFQETLSDVNDPESHIPDVLFKDKKGKPVVGIEITKTKNVEYAKFVFVELLGCTPIEEVFMLDFQQKIWYYANRKEQTADFFDKFKDYGFPDWKEVKIHTGISYSEVLGIDLEEYISLK